MKFHKQTAEDLTNYMKQQDPYYMEFHGRWRDHLPSVLGQATTLFV